MKKYQIYFTILMLIILFMPIIYAEETTTNLEDKIDLKQNFNNIQESVDQFFKGETTIKIPENLQIFARFIFGIKGEIPAQVFIILIAIWIILLILMFEILDFMPFMNRGIPKFLGAFIITCLIALSGGIRSSAIFFLNLGNLFGVLEKGWAPIAFLIVFIIVIILGYGLNIILKMIRHKTEMEDATRTGQEIGLLAKIAHIYRESMKDK